MGMASDERKTFVARHGRELLANLSVALAAASAGLTVAMFWGSEWNSSTWNRAAYAQVTAEKLRAQVEDLKRAQRRTETLVAGFKTPLVPPDSVSSAIGEVRSSIEGVDKRLATRDKKQSESERGVEKKQASQ